MMITIGELAVLDEHAAFRNDVQLDAFDDPELNLALLRSYLFTQSSRDDSTGEVRSVSPVRILDEIVDTFLTGAINRFALIADYGHGKSHLALALANYFAKPLDSPEIAIVLGKLAHTLAAEPAKVKRFRQFKENRGPILVVRLRGDVVYGLREQFVISLRSALDACEATRDLDLNLWYSGAEKFLLGLRSESMAASDDFLAQYDTDVAGLLQSVKSGRNVFQICENLHVHLFGTYPNFGRQVSLKDTVIDIVDRVCGDGKPFGGLLVLFDELSLYLENYARQGITGEFQDLLNGIDLRRGRAVFLGFALYDPLSKTDGPMANSNNAGNAFQREVTRIERRFLLYSVMENVIDAYLQQSRIVWHRFEEELNTLRLHSALTRASGVTLERFQKRYERDLHWRLSEFTEYVTMGCFPLHPLTTALLCNLKLGTGGDTSVPRTVLGFVMAQHAAKKAEPAVLPKRINWVLPIELVEYFGNRIANEAYSAYEKARFTAGAEMTEQEHAVLKALLLQRAGDLAVKGVAQLELLSEAAGLTIDEARHALTRLAQCNSIFHNPLQNDYSLWSSTDDPHKLEQKIQQHLARMPFTYDLLLRLNQDFPELTSKSYGYIPISVPWGHPEDWAARELILTNEYFNSVALTSYVRRWSATNQTIEEADRGYVIWLVARDENEITQLRASVSSAIDTMFKDDRSVPMVVVLPARPIPELIEGYRRWLVLNAFTQQERVEVGIQMFSIQLERTKSHVLDAINQLRGDKLPTEALRPLSGLVVPLAYRAQISQLHTLVPLRKVLDELYKLAYRFAPPEFMTSYKVSSSGQNKLRDATKQVAGTFFDNKSVSLPPAITTNGTARTLCDTLIKRWQILTDDYRIQSPVNSKLHQGWQYLDNVFAPTSGRVEIATALISLFNPPFGYDYNSAVLLFAAWFGFSGHDLKVMRGGGTVGHSVLMQALEKGSKDFFLQLAANKTAIARRKPMEQEQEIRALVGRINGGKISQSEVPDILSRMTSFDKDERNVAELRTLARQAIDSLTIAFQTAVDYDKEAQKLKDDIQKETSPARAVNLQARIAKLPKATTVTVTALREADLQKLLHDRVAELSAHTCQKYEQIRELTDLALNKKVLANERKALSDAGMGDLVTMIDKSVATLERNAEALSRKAKEAPIRERIKTMDVGAKLNVLTKYVDELIEVTDYSPEVMGLRAAKLSAIKNEIDALEGKVRTLQSSLLAIDSEQKLESWRESVIKIQDRLHGSEYESTLRSLLQKGSELRDFFASVSSVSHSALNTPTDVTIRIRRLEDILAKYPGALGSVQVELVTREKAKAQEIAEKERKRAADLLRTCQHEYANGAALLRLRDKLREPPAFLSNEDLTRWNALCVQVQDKVDQDIVLDIEDKFRSIADPSKRLACLQRLQSFISDTEPAVVSDLSYDER